jgi:hypothetical protein
MADLYDYLTPSGVILPDTADVQGTVEQEYRDALGQNLNVDQGPQQVLIAAETTSRQAVLRLCAALANQINPDQAGGVFLDALWKLTGGARLAEGRSVVHGVGLTGQPGTLIPAGSLAATAAGDQFASVADVTLGAGGTAAVDFQAVNTGAVPCGSGALTVIASGVLGWETVVNTSAAVVGQARESDAAARLRRRNTLALQGVALPEAIVSALYDVAGVQSLSFRENKSNAGATVDGIVMLANSVWACVNGGADAAIAAAILANTSLGCQWTGATTVNVTDATSGQVYAVKFDRPTNVPILVRVTVKANNVVGDPVALVQSALLAYAAGQMEGERGFVVGGSVSPFELGGGVSRQNPGMYVQKVEIMRTGGAFAVAEIALALNELATLTGSAITVITL